MEYASMKMPDLVRPAYELPKLREVYLDYAFLAFKLPDPMTVVELDEAVNDCYGLTKLYHFMRSRQTDYGQSLCFFQEPGTGEMFQMDCFTNSDGKIHRIDVKLYNSMERMVTELRQQLVRQKVSPGEFDYLIDEYELLTHFL